jgi:hypothetical protein
MQTDNRNPQLSTFAYIVTVIEFGVLCAATLGLFFLPEIARPLWPWTIAPFNTRFMGAVYAGSAIAAVTAVIGKRWHPARLVLIMVLVFSAYVDVLSFLYLPQFDFSKWATWLWFIFYLFLPINATYFLWKFRDQPKVDPIPLSVTSHMALMGIGIVLTLYTLALLIAPLAATSFWPWAIDAFHARMYAAMFLGAGVGSIVVSLGAPASEMLTVALGEIGFALFSIAGLVIVDLEMHKVNWSLAGTWLWLAMFIAIFSAGLLGLVLARRSTVAA